MVDIPGMPVPPIGRSQGVGPAGPARTGPTEGSSKPFADYLAQKLEEVSDLQVNAEGEIQKLVSGQDTDLTSVVLAVRKADLAFKALMEIRNKLVDAYEEIIQARG